MTTTATLKARLERARRALPKPPKEKILSSEEMFRAAQNLIKEIYGTDQVPEEAIRNYETEEEYQESVARAVKQAEEILAEKDAEKVAAKHRRWSRRQTTPAACNSTSSK